MERSSRNGRPIRSSISPLCIHGIVQLLKEEGQPCATPPGLEGNLRAKSCGVLAAPALGRDGPRQEFARCSYGASQRAPYP